MTNEELKQLLAVIKQQAAKNPYWLFLYDWNIISFVPRVIAAKEIMFCFDKLQFPPIGKN